MIRKSKCSYKRKCFNDVQQHFDSCGERRVNLRTIINSSQRISEDAMTYLVWVSKVLNISRSNALEKIIKNSILFEIDYSQKPTPSSVSKNKIPKLLLHPAYIDIIKLLKVEKNLSWVESLEHFILNYKKKFKFPY